MDLKPTGFRPEKGEVMEPATGRPDAGSAEFSEFIERCHDALRQHTGGNPRP